MSTERITFQDGNWWEVRTTITRGMRKAFRAAGLKSFSGLNGEAVDLNEPGDIQKYIMAHPASLDLNAVDDAYLLHGTVAWSFEGDISLQAIDGMDDAVVEEVLERMRELYAEPTEEESKK